ncbi:MAG: UDP-N-acetylmuramate dehydrogenase [Phycisphaerales bacterium]|jgi:UDP-N-acetylmuramate dehydrogenase|nr:UDP-N-acetylmuramate dehydrogenase [Phycisphaerales bacterium]
MLPKFQSSLLGDLDVDIKLDAQIGAKTYFSVGGRADALIRPKSADSLSILLRRCYEGEIPLRILGKGANLLVDDIGVDGVVVKLDHPCFMQTRYNREESIESLHTMAGADLAETLMDTVRRGLDGLTAITGIPATIGGAIRMNAGGKYGSVSDSISTITCLTNLGELVTYDKSSLHFGYRESRIVDPIILSATFELQPSDPVVIRDRVKEIFAWKKSKQPLADTSAGCAFKNPFSKDGSMMSAGKIIDEVGLKGLTIGGASVSERHANFIVTRPEATARDVLNLMNEIQHRVNECTNILLQREVVVWSRDPEVQR